MTKENKAGEGETPLFISPCSIIDLFSERNDNRMSFIYDPIRGGDFLMAYESSSMAVTIKDSSKEVSGTSFPVGLITAANFADRITDHDALIQAIEGVINGKIQKSALVWEKKYATTEPAGQGARRETKLLISYEDSVTLAVGAWTIPTFDIAKVTMIAGTDEVDMSSTAAAALRTAIQNGASSPAGNPVIVRSMRSVGRNL